MTFGWILVVVSILPTGDVSGTSIDYFEHKEDCIYSGDRNVKHLQRGESFVCVEDYYGNRGV